MAKQPVHLGKEGEPKEGVIGANGIDSISGKSKRGRPRTKTPKTWTPEQLKQIDTMAEAQCKDTTISQSLGIDDDTFKRHFAERTRRKRAAGKAELHGLQQKRARKGSDVMLIWLGKQHLEQTDKQVQEHTGTVEHKIVLFGKPDPDGSSANPAQS